MKKPFKQQFHHIGLPTDERRPGEAYVSDTKVWVTDPRNDRYRVEYLRFEHDSPVKGPARDLPHIAFKVDDMAAAIDGEDVILPPFSPSPGFTVAYIFKDGAVIEYMTYEKESDLPWK